MKKTMTMSASEGARHDRWIAIVASIILLIGTAAFLVISSPNSQASEIPDGSEAIVSEEVDGDVIPQPMNRLDASSDSDDADDGNYDSIDGSAWFKEEEATNAAPADPEQAKREEAARQQKEAQMQESRRMMDANSETRKQMEEEKRLANESVLASQSPSTLRIFGEEIPYIYSYNVVSAPSRGCGIWKGVDDVNDGDYTYFVGHNPGDFYNVMNLVPGNTVSLCDANGNTREYTVHDVFTIPQRTTFQDIQARVEGHGESIIMQTCCGDNVNVRVVVAY